MSEISITTICNWIWPSEEYKQTARTDKKNEKFRINLLNSTPIVRKTDSIPLKLMAAFQNEIKSLPKAGIVSKSRSCYASPAFLIAKRDQSVRIIIDFLALNSHIQKEQLPFSSVFDNMYKLQNMRVFSGIDPNKGYHQL